MIYTLEEAQKIAIECLQVSVHIQSKEHSQLKKNIKTVYLLSQMVSLGVPSTINKANEWAKLSEGNALLLQIYIFIAKTQDVSTLLTDL